MSNSDLDDLAAELAEFAPPEKKKDVQPARNASSQVLRKSSASLTNMDVRRNTAKIVRSSSASMQCGSTGYAVSQTAVPC